MWRYLKLCLLGKDAEMEYVLSKIFWGDLPVKKGRRQDQAEEKLTHRWLHMRPQLILPGAPELGWTFRVSNIAAGVLALISLISYPSPTHCLWGRHTCSSYPLLCDCSKLNGIKQQTCYYILQICGSGIQTGLSWLILLIYISLTGWCQQMVWCGGSDTTSLTCLSPWQGRLESQAHLTLPSGSLTWFFSTVVSEQFGFLHSSSGLLGSLLNDRVEDTGRASLPWNSVD